MTTFKKLLRMRKIEEEAGTGCLRQKGIALKDVIESLFRLFVQIKTLLLDHPVHLCVVIRKGSGHHRRHASSGYVQKKKN